MVLMGSFEKFLTFFVSFWLIRTCKKIIRWYDNRGHRCFGERKPIFCHAHSIVSLIEIADNIQYKRLDQQVHFGRTHSIWQKRKCWGVSTNTGLLLLENLMYFWQCLLSDSQIKPTPFYTFQFLLLQDYLWQNILIWLIFFWIKISFDMALSRLIQ